MAVFWGHGATDLISAAIYLTMCLLALWWLISALRDGVPTRRIAFPPLDAVDVVLVPARDVQVVFNLSKTAGHAFKSKFRPPI
jgi:hypothetical protein